MNGTENAESGKLIKTLYMHLNDFLIIKDGLLMHGDENTGMFVTYIEESHIYDILIETFDFKTKTIRNKKYTVSVNEDTVLLIKEWNNVLISLLVDQRYKTMLGDIGNKLVKFKSRCQDYAARCVDDAPDVNVQSLHYALRFQENIKFLNRKIEENERLSFIDFGCGLSPLSVVVQNEYSLVNCYCIDIVPEIADLYTNASYQLIGKMLKQGWKDVGKFITEETLKGYGLQIQY